MAKRKSTKQKTKASGRISNVTRPSRMSLKEWQIKLRIQAADKENFSITGNGNGEFVVSNYSTSHKYEVVWKGLGHPLNRCSCMDFRTSRLMTCKHLEAVKKHIRTNKSYTDFVSETKTKKSVQTVLITTYGLREGAHADDFQKVLTLEHLFTENME